MRVPLRVDLWGFLVTFRRLSAEGSNSTSKHFLQPPPDQEGCYSRGVALNYTIDRSTDSKTYWKCAYSRTVNCKGRIHTDLNHSTILTESTEHNHSPSAVNVEVRLFQEELCSRVAETTKSTQRVIDNCLLTASDQLAARLPNFKHVKRTIQRQRQQNDLPKAPTIKMSPSFHRVCQQRFEATNFYNSILDLVIVEF